MRTKHWFLMVAFMVLVQGVSGQKDGSAPGESRVWTDATGREIIASLVGFKDEKTVLLKLGDGREVPYPIEKLGAADQKIAREAFSQKSKAPTAPTAPTMPAAGAEVDWANPKQSESYLIRSVREGGAPGYLLTKAGWEDEGDCLEVKVQYKGEEESVTGKIAAYFYDREGKLLEEYKAPPKRREEDVYFDPPASFEKGKTLEVYFPISHAVKDGDWKSAVVVFGNGNEISVEMVGTRTLEGLDFPEKTSIFPGLKE